MTAFIDLRALLLGTPGDRIPVGGARVGESAQQLLQSNEITGAEESAPSTEGRLVYTEGTVFREALDGTRVEIPLRSRVEGVAARGGTLRFGQIAVRVENGQVGRVFVRGEALERLSIRSESDIANRFGVPSGTETAFGRRDHHYPERQLVIGWSLRENRLEYVALGPDPWREPRRGALDLLAELLWSFDELDGGGWVEPSSGSLRTRFRRIASLARALGLGEPRAVAAGEFLDDELSEERERVLVEISRTTSPEATAGAFPVRVYQRLLEHRLQAERVIGFNRGVLECSIPTLAGVMVAQEAVAESLKESLTVVDGWLCRLMDPEGRTFSEAELIRSFGWPDVDVRQQEAEEAWGE